MKTLLIAGVAVLILAGGGLFLRLRIKEAAVFNGPRGTQDAPFWALQDIVHRVVTKAPERYATLDGLGLSRDQRIDAAPLKSAVDLAYPASAVTALMSIPVVASTSPTWGSIISPSFVWPVVTATSKTTPALSSTAVCCL
jgi:hypothetical protein